MKRGNLTIALSLALVFLSGAAVGAFSSRLFSTTAVSAEVQPKRKTPEDYRREYIDEMRAGSGLIGMAVLSGSDRFLPRAFAVRICTDVCAASRRRIPTRESRA